MKKNALLFFSLFAMIYSINFCSAGDENTETKGACSVQLTIRTYPGLTGCTGGVTANNVFLDYCTDNVLPSKCVTSERCLPSGSDSYYSGAKRNHVAGSTCDKIGYTYICPVGWATNATNCKSEDFPEPP